MAVESKNLKEAAYLTKEQKDSLLELYKAGKEIANLRRKTLLLMFYSKEECSEISPDDLYELEQKLEEKIPDGVNELDLCIQTMGGDANSSYLLAQLIRSYCNRMETIIPNYAYSGGTLISLASEKILLGRTARISPIDLQLTFVDDDSPSSFALVNIEKYIEFLIDMCHKFKFRIEEDKAKFLTSLTKPLIEEYSTAKLGELFRLKGLTEFHAKILLIDYMFKNEPEKKVMVERIIKRLTTDNPTHDFEMDYNIIKKVIGLKVEDLNRNLYKLTRQLINKCSKAKKQGLICDFATDNQRRPFFEVFLPDELEVNNE